MKSRTYVASLIARIRALFGVTEPTTRQRRRYPRSLCPVCGGTYAVTSKGAYKHRCLAPKGDVA